VTGALLATFFALEVFGNRLTLWSACGLNVLVAIARGCWRADITGARPFQKMNR
jgi:hypothetical protein